VSGRIPVTFSVIGLLSVTEKQWHSIVWKLLIKTLTITLHTSKNLNLNIRFKSVGSKNYDWFRIVHRLLIKIQLQILEFQVSGTMNFKVTVFWNMTVSGVYKFSKNLGVTSEFYSPEWLHETNSILRTINIERYLTPYFRGLPCILYFSPVYTYQRLKGACCLHEYSTLMIVTLGFSNTS